MTTLSAFQEVWLADFEYTAPPGDWVTPNCLVARELGSGRVVRLFGDELRRQTRPPYPTDRRSLFVAYNAAAEIGCHLVLGWPVPECILDLFVEFRALTNGLRMGQGHRLLDALTYFGVNGISAAHKDAMVQLALRGEPFTKDEQAALLDYCESDVTALADLIPHMTQRVDLPRAVLRRVHGRRREDGERGDPHRQGGARDPHGQLVEHRRGAHPGGRRSYGVFQGRTFKRDLFMHYVANHNMTWPFLPSGAPALDDDTFGEMAKVYPEIAPLHQLRRSLGQLRLADLVVGSDGRNRTAMFPFSSRTSRNQPSNVKFAFGLAAWLRGLVRPEPGKALAYVDWSQQEFGIAAALSGDAAMMHSYQTGDPYLAFAIQAGVVPPTATKETHGDERERFKSCVLGVQYCMEAGSLALRIGQSTAHAAELLRLHRATYPKFWRWVRAAVDYAMLGNQIHTVFGWTVRLTQDPNTRSVQNFPMQANGAEMMRLACSLATERGIRVCAPVHDALLVEADGDHIGEVVMEDPAGHAGGQRDRPERLLPGGAMRRSFGTRSGMRTSGGRRCGRPSGRCSATTRTPLTRAAMQQEDTCPRAHPPHLFSLCRGQPVDLDQLRLDPGHLPAARPTQRRWAPRRGERFLLGPVPWAWLVQAGRLPGRAAQVALRLWHQVGLEKSLTVSLNLTAIGLEFGFNRTTAGRALEALVRAGLARVQPRAGRRHIVTVILTGDDACRPRPRMSRRSRTPMNAPTRAPADRD